MKNDDNNNNKQKKLENEARTNTWRLKSAGCEE
jgi:hypothetical protein